ncbi:UDP-N-acetylmuramoyl-tripeptide--D-alanyl-D-alanine ligase [Formivibrio citricus]
MLSLRDAAMAMKGELAGDGSRTVARVTTDSRDVQPGDLFFALKGEHFDGHAFVEQALKDGAVAAVVSEPGPGARIVVQDTLQALGELAASWRQRFANVRVIGVTGSNGKTTAKEMIAAILATHAGAECVHATRGNLNNHIGLPLTLLGMREGCRFVVAEMGMNHFGEIAYLTRIARPDVALITNAGQAHLEMLGSVEGVARAKGEIYEGLAEQGCAVINADDAQSPLWKQLAGNHRQIAFGLQSAEVGARELDAGEEGTRFVLTTPAGEASVALPVPGVHNVRNALAAAAVAQALNVPLATIAQALTGYRGVKGRLEAKRAFNGARLVDDTYNANPDSMKAAADVLSTANGKKILVLGDMGEVGADAPQRHAEIGAYAREKGIDALYAVGKHMAEAVRTFGAGRHFATHEALAAALRAELPANAVVLVKGSRFMQMERVVKLLQENN